MQYSNRRTNDMGDERPEFLLRGEHEQMDYYLAGASREFLERLQDQKQEIQHALELLESRTAEDVRFRVHRLSEVMARSTPNKVTAAGRRLADMELQRLALRLLPWVIRSHEPQKAAAVVAAGRMMGLELEGLSAEDSEFEVARRFVRYARDRLRNSRGVIERQCGGSARFKGGNHA